MTSLCPLGSCTPPFCSIYGMPLCCQQQEPSIIPDLVIPPLEWSSSLPLSFEVLFVCLPNIVISLHRQTCPNKLSFLCLMTSVIDSVVKMSILTLICCNPSAHGNTSNSLQAVHLKNLKILGLLDRSTQASAPYIAIGSIKAPYNLAFTLVFQQSNHGFGPMQQWIQRDLRGFKTLQATEGVLDPPCVHGKYYCKGQHICLHRN